MKITWTGSLLMTALLAGAGCAKPAVVRPDAKAEAPPADAAKSDESKKTAATDEAKGNEAKRNTSAQAQATKAEALRESTIYFEYDSDVLTEAAREHLATFVEQVNKTGLKATLVLEGHADERGTEEYNLALGDRRANAVRRYLEQMGLNGNQMRAVSYGENKPAASGEGEGTWSRNRRVEIVPPHMTSSLQ